MKKKLVAFAVTAAMVITSAVPALAWEATGDKVPETNEVVISGTHLKDGIVENYNNTAITDSAEYSITVDFNRTSGDFQYVLNMVGNQGQESQERLAIFAKDAGNTLVMADASGNQITELGSVSPKGITTLTWSFDTSHAKKYVELTVNDLGNYGVEHTFVMELPTEAQYVESVVFEGWDAADVDAGEYAVVYQNQIPDEVTEVEVVKAELNSDSTAWVPELDKYGDVQVVTQPVLGEHYIVNSITLNDGTVIKNDDMAKISDYVNFAWTVTKRDGSVLRRDPADNFGTRAEDQGAYVTLTVSGNKTSGIFGETVWGEGADSLAIQERIAGENRYETAMKVADEMKLAGGFSKIFVATGTNYADALSVTALANQQNAPILLVNAAYEDEVIQYIKDNIASYDAEIYIVGGANAVSTDFEKALKKVTVNVDRLAGDDRYATNIEVLKMFHEEGSLGSMLVASGANYPDALSAAATGKPVLLVGNELTREQRTYLHDVGAMAAKANKKISYTIIGGRDAVSNDLRDELASKNLYNATVDRIGGVNRYETNMMVMDEFVPTIDSAKYVFVASGMDYPDALTGGVLAAQNGAPLVLVNANVTDPASDTVDRVADNTDYAGMVVIGGENAVSNATVQKIA